MYLLVNLTTFLSFFFWGAFEIFKRYTNTRVFNKKNESLWRLLEYPITVSIDLAVIAIPTFVIAAFRVLMKNRVYRVAEKKILA
jgi:hypothetical protein